MADTSDLYDILLTFTELDGNTKLVDKLIQKGRKMLENGNGSVSSLLSSTLNGKSFNVSVEFSILDVLKCAMGVKKKFETGHDPYTNVELPDFRCIIR